MATYAELAELYDRDDIARRCEMALLVAGKALVDAPAPTDRQREWVREVYTSPRSEARLMLKYILATRRAQTVDEIVSITDAELQQIADGITAHLLPSA